MHERDQAARWVEIVALACTTSVAITVATGLPIVRIVAREGAFDLGDRRRHDGWSILPFDTDGAGPWPAEVHVAKGRLWLDVPCSVAIAAFQDELDLALEPHRLDLRPSPERLQKTDGSWTLLLPEGVAFHRRIGAHRLLAIDPTRRMPHVARLALAARGAAIRRLEDDHERGGRP